VPSFGWVPVGTLSVGVEFTSPNEFDWTSYCREKNVASVKKWAFPAAVDPTARRVVRSRH